ncbi:MAG: GAF domain-containing protein [Myxococcaceae bacterium]|nr:GAF domain-containing protein [Myxococcaceae bacterium]MCA3014524.1 GAF domain-containing protein [Myxococcaceae bacterium]
MDLAAYLSRTGLSVSEAAAQEAQAALQVALAECRKASVPGTPQALARLYSFPVPKLSADGTCSLVSELAPTPYDLVDALGGRGVGTTLCLMVLNALVEATWQRTGLDWLGVYQVRVVGEGPALVKLAARGLPSRAEFPLTDAFEARSTNVAVARSGRPRLIADVRAHASAGGAYYECDPKVQSEACLPLFGGDGAVVGIVDAEHSAIGAFDDARLGWLVALAFEVPAHLPG